MLAIVRIFLILYVTFPYMKMDICIYMIYFFIEINLFGVEGYYFLEGIDFL
jgi:hypothetical protein